MDGKTRNAEYTEFRWNILSEDCPLASWGGGGGVGRIVHMEVMGSKR
jgi:hypothetical protein